MPTPPSDTAVSSEAASALAAMPLGVLLASISAKTPTPGGGAVACTVGALGAATAGMVVSFSVGKKDLLPFQPELEAIGRDLARLRAIFLELAVEDEAAYAALNALQKLRPDDPARLAGWESAVAACVMAPMSSVAASEELARRCEGLCAKSNKHLRSDLAVAALLASAAAEAGACNVRINLPLMTDEPARARTAALLAAMLDRVNGSVASVRKACG